MTWCRTFCRYIRFWLRTPIEWDRIWDEGGTKRLFLTAANIFIAFIIYITPNYVVPEFVRLAIYTIFVFIILSQCVEFTYTYRRTLFRSMLQFHANEIRNPGYAWRPGMEAIPLDPPLGHPMDNPQNPQLHGLHQRQIDVQGPPELFRGQQFNQEQQNPRPVRHREVYQEMRPTDRVRSRRQQDQSSRSSSSHTQAKPTVRQSAWASLNPQQTVTGYRDMSSEIADRARSLLTFRDDGQRSCRGQAIEMRSFVGGERRGEQSESSSHSYYPINYKASSSRSTIYGCPEISQQKLQTGSIDDSCTRKSESDDSNRSSRGKGEDNSSNKSSPEKDESRDSSQDGCKATNKSKNDKNDSNSPPRSSPEKDQSCASNTNSPEKPVSTESSPHCRTQPKTSESSTLQQIASLSPGSSCILAKSTVIKMSQSGVGLRESNEPVKTHKSSSSKSSYKQKDIISTKKDLQPPKQKITKQAPISETSLTDTSISKRKVSSSEEHSDLESFTSRKKKVPKSSSEILPKPSGEPTVHSSTRRVIYSVKRKRETSSEEEDGSSTQSKKQTPSKPRSKIPKIDEEADGSSTENKTESFSKSRRPKNPEDADSESSN